MTSASTVRLSAGSPVAGRIVSPRTKLAVNAGAVPQHGNRLGSSRSGHVWRCG
ncbi:hypothetical protein SAMN02799622_02635 [Methylobacterium sp. UNC378MF]|nr:hypothetical protein SAMN02799622_02635 [Methylobacterium sp. UNC378MF]